ncbi:hypothetical protein [Kineococcus sp. SYSU DK005]|uniref:hypothetical protein n=1 Tax=Kineococcus sp. SYSU DK005 TaxID=3383126 RepID=UPI003D7C3CCA
MNLTACREHSPAEWIATPERPWHRLVGLGPGGYPAYARLRFIPDPTGPDQAEADVDSENTAALETARLRTTAAVLAAHTGTPRRCYFAIWDGWGYLPTAHDVPLWSPIAERSYFLFTGDLHELGEPAAWEAALRPLHHPASSGRPDPAFVWPADRAWCLTRDVDPHYATIAASTAAVDDLLHVPDLDIVRADPDEDPPHYL